MPTEKNPNSGLIESELIAIISKQYPHILGYQTLDHKPSIEKIIADIATYYDDIIDCMPGNVHIYDQECRGVKCNANVLKMFNFTSHDQFSGLSFEDMGKIASWTPEATQSFKNDTLQVLRTGKPVLNVDEPPIPNSEGKTLFFLSSRVPLFNRLGETIGVVCISFDITERKQMELALIKAKADAEAANNLKIEFIRNMEHDIRTPFSGIYGIAKILLDNETDLKKKDFLQDIVNSSQELLDYSTGILDFSMIESGSLPLLSKKFQLSKLLHSLISIETPPAKLKKLDFTAQCDPEVPNVILGDRYRLQRILINLLSNAIKFTNTGHVRLQVKMAKKINNRNIVLSFIVEDTGIGIPREKQHVIFERFTRLLPSNQRIYQGTGLGLRLVKQFVEEMDGDIELKSVVNGGTTFICTFPFKLPLIDSVMDEE